MDADVLRTKFRVLHDKVIVEVADPEEKKTPGGIILPAGRKAAESNDGRAIECVVVAKGPGLWGTNSKGKPTFWVNTAVVGSRVVVKEASLFEVKPTFDGMGKSQFFQCHDDDILAIIDGDGDITSVSDELEAAAQ